jgi:hypothetical protein
MTLGHCTALALSAAVVGCTGAVSAPVGAGDADAATTTSAVVIVERTADASGATRGETSARFVRIPARSSKQDALRTIGAALDLPPSGTCASIASLVDVASQHEPTPVIELADVGSVSLEAEGRETRLIPRQLPDVTDVVSGMVYARAADAALFPAGGRYVVHVGGVGDLDPFDATAAAPSDPTDVHISGEDAAGGLVVASGASLELAWTPDGTDDVLYVDLQPTAFRCVLGDGPSPPAYRTVTSVPASLLDDTGTVVVHRVHRENLVVRGLESGEIRFDFSRAVSYARR